MKMKLTPPILLITLFTTAMSAQAHDPKEHMKDAEKPDCSAMKDMDHSKMDMDDPVMQAMMKQCMSEANRSVPDQADKRSEEQKSEPQHSGH